MDECQRPLPRDATYERVFSWEDRPVYASRCKPQVSGLTPDVGSTAVRRRIVGARSFIRHKRAQRCTYTQALWWPARAS